MPKIPFKERRGAMERGTINGIPIQQVFQKLKEDIPGVVKMTDEKEDCMIEEPSL